MAMGGAIQNECEDRARVEFCRDDSRLFFDAQETKKVSERTVII